MDLFYGAETLKRVENIMNGDISKFSSAQMVLILVNLQETPAGFYIYNTKNIPYDCVPCPVCEGKK